MIAEKYWKEIKTLNVDDGPPQRFPIKYWKNPKHETKTLKDRIGVIEALWGDGLTRAGVLKVYQRPELDNVTKFLIAMLWGYGDVEGGRPDYRGPARMADCFAEGRAGEAIAAIDSVTIGSDEEIKASFKKLLKLYWCGPAFFTKHLYFLGKAKGGDEYPLIYDARVAAGLLASSGVDPALMSILSITPSVKPEAYIDYLKLCRTLRKQIGCRLDQIELFLFNGPNAA